MPYQCKTYNLVSNKISPSLDQLCISSIQSCENQQVHFTGSRVQSSFLSFLPGFTSGCETTLNLGNSIVFSSFAVQGVSWTTCAWLAAAGMVHYASRSLLPAFEIPAKMLSAEVIFELHPWNSLHQRAHKNVPPSYSITWQCECAAGTERLSKIRVINNWFN